MGMNEMKCDCCAVHEDAVECVRNEIAEADRLQAMSELYKLLGDSTRLHILAALNCRKMCVCDLAVLLDMTKSAVSHQLKVLRDGNLVKYEKQGKHSFYSLADDHVKYILNISLDHVKE